MQRAEHHKAHRPRNQHGHGQGVRESIQVVGADLLGHALDILCLHLVTVKHLSQEGHGWYAEQSRRGALNRHQPREDGGAVTWVDDIGEHRPVGGRRTPRRHEAKEEHQDEVAEKPLRQSWHKLQDNRRRGDAQEHRQLCSERPPVCVAPFGELVPHIAAEQPPQPSTCLQSGPKHSCLAVLHLHVLKVHRKPAHCVPRDGAEDALAREAPEARLTKRPHQLPSLALDAGTYARYTSNTLCCGSHGRAVSGHLEV
mmetsp:Transcript_46321/g.115242  ORF Transcript_46321/g.115242 Transcript_46321/m.115242 type:complete len:255 (+) Transcript_46321:1064-1828(+)